MLPAYKEEREEEEDDYEAELERNDDNDEDEEDDNEDYRIVVRRNQIARLRHEREEAQRQYESTCREYHRSIHVLQSKLQRNLKRGTDIRRYNMAMSSSASSMLLLSSQSSRTIPFDSAAAATAAAESFVPQQYVQQQARLLQAWHKTSILEHQMDWIQKHCNDAVTTMMVDASTLEQDLKKTECELMIQLGEAMNERFDLESKHHGRIRDQVEQIRTLRGRIIPEEIEIMVRKRMDDAGSVDTMDTWYDSGSVLTYSDAAFEVGVSGTYLWPLAIF